MKRATPLTEASASGAHVLKWTILGVLGGVMAGLASACFLWSLDLATRTHQLHPALIWGLPVAGVAIGYLYHRVGRDVAGGNDLLLDRIHDPSGVIPFRMAPLILATTLLTQLFGGSAGREGTAVQMGGTLIDLLTKPFRLGPEDRRLLLMAGIAAGFGSVFGAPLAGAVFGMEVFSVGRFRAEALVPCLIASVVGDLVTRSTGIHHAVYGVASPITYHPALVATLVVAAMLFALTAVVYVEALHRVQAVGQGWRHAYLVRPAVGGVAIVALTLLVGNQAYNGLSLDLLARAFTMEGVPLYAFALKLLFTVITLGMGFKGGEVTPLFCIGATLGGALAVVTGQDPALFAGLGMVAVFAAAANTPLACTVLGIELFGAAWGVPLAVVCALAFALSGHRGIYGSQRIARPKASRTQVHPDISLREARAAGVQLHPSTRRFRSWLGRSPKPLPVDISSPKSRTATGSEPIDPREC